MISTLTYMVSTGIIVTKFFDSLTTQRKIKGVEMEMNPIARILMHRYGINGTIWGIFAITIVITAVSQYWIQFSTTAILWDCGYIITGSFTALVQGATALNNYQGRPNFVTKRLFHLLRRVNQ